MILKYNKPENVSIITWDILGLISDTIYLEGEGQQYWMIWKPKTNEILFLNM